MTSFIQLMIHHYITQQNPDGNKLVTVIYGFKNSFAELGS